MDALRKCPDLTLVKPHHTMYREKSRAFIAILQQYSDTIEQFSVDEAFVDMTGTERLFGTPVEADQRAGVPRTGIYGKCRCIVEQASCEDGE